MIYEKLRNRYIDSGEFELLLKDSGVLVLKEFLENWDAIERFNKQFYGENPPKIVLCGINPGKNGAGKTGIPFLDFSSLSKIVNGVDRKDTERSAQFFYDVVEEIGVSNFYRSFYVTNISWVGYIKDGRNINYYDIPSTAKKFVYDMFRYEMELLSSTTIISLSGEVKKTVTDIFGNSDINIDAQLPHPNYSAFPKNYEGCKAKYVDLLSEYVSA